MFVKTLGVVGCGLIGGSIALAAKKYECFQRVVGRDIEQNALDFACELGVIDSVWQAGDEVDGVCLAVPTRHIAEHVERLQDEVAESVPIFDVGSVKKSLLGRNGSLPANFVPCHPIAGSHKSGPASADAELFRGNVCVIAPTEATDDAIVSEVATWWRQFGATVHVMDAAKHDEILGVTSHLPHVLACAAVDLVRNQGEATSKLIGSGFRDFSRIAAGNETIWRDIVVDNLTNLRIGFRELSARVETIFELAEEDPTALEDLLREITSYRKSIND